MIHTKDLSVNPFEFIRQCKEGHLFTTNQGIIDQSWMHGAKFTGRVIHLLGKTNQFDWVILQSQRTMVKELATEMLGKVLYTQEEFAGKLIALMTEFGVGVALVDSEQYPRNSTNYGFGVKWFVIIYTPEQWGERIEFSSMADAEIFAAKVNSYGDFIL